MLKYRLSRYQVDVNVEKRVTIQQIKITTCKYLLI